MAAGERALASIGRLRLERFAFFKFASCPASGSSACELGGSCCNLSSYITELGTESPLNMSVICQKARKFAYDASLKGINCNSFWPSVDDFSEDAYTAGLKELLQPIQHAR